MEIHYRFAPRKSTSQAVSSAISAAGEIASRLEFYANARTAAKFGYITLSTLERTFNQSSQGIDNLGHYLPIETLNSRAVVASTDHHLPRLALKTSYPQIFTRSSPDYFKAN